MNIHKHLLLAALITLLGIGGLGVGLMYAFHREALTAFLSISGQDLGRQMAIGLAYAAISLFILLLVLRQPFLEPTRRFFASLISKYAVTTPVIVLLSLCAGIGEELLFRGAIQPWLGIWLTAFVFILLHGYLDPRNRPLAVYGMILMVVSAGFGYLAQQFGIISAMTAHAIIDIGLLWYLKQTAGN
jgi:membrane protease YdiL (CAAX protease family)